MSIAHDIYAETNPAFYAWALRSFTKAYQSIHTMGPELPIAYVALPIALSGDLASAFGGTNKRTGLLEWLERSPQVQVGLAERLNASVEMVTAGLRFGCFAGAVALTTCGQLQAGATGLKPITTAGFDDEVIQAFKRSERLGYWFAMAGSTRNLFDIMGLSV